MESALIPYSRLQEKHKWVYSAHSHLSLQIERNIASTQFDVVPLGDLVEEIADGLHGVRRYVDEGIVMLAVGNVTEYGLDFSDRKLVTQEEHNRLKRSQVKRGDLLVTITGRLGSTLVYESDESANLSAHVARVKVNEKAVNPYYLAAYLNSKIGKQLIDEFSIGSIYPHINVNRLRSVRVIRLPQSLQDQIAQIMQEAYSDRQKKLAEAQRLLKSIDSFILEALDIKFDNISFERHFSINSRELKNNRFDVDFHLPETHCKYEALKLSRKCKIIGFGTLIEQIANGATPKGASYLSEGIPFFRIQNIIPDGLDLSDIVYISKQTHDEMRRSQTRPGDLLMTITGRVGTAAVIPSSIEEGNINQHIVIIRLKSEVINVNYLATVINSSAVSFQASHRTTGTTRIALDYKAIKSLLIPVPDCDTQERLLEEVTRRRYKAESLRSQAEAVVTAAKARVERMILGEEVVE